MLFPRRYIQLTPARAGAVLSFFTCMTSIPFLMLPVKCRIVSALHRRHTHDNTGLSFWHPLPLPVLEAGTGTGALCPGILPAFHRICLFLSYFSLTFLNVFLCAICIQKVCTPLIFQRYQSTRALPFRAFAFIVDISISASTVICFVVFVLSFCKRSLFRGLILTNTNAASFRVSEISGSLLQNTGCNSTLILLWIRLYDYSLPSSMRPAGRGLFLLILGKTAGCISLLREILTPVFCLQFFVLLGPAYQT